MIKVGDAAPDFDMKDQRGTRVCLADLLQAGEVVLYFYPADFTPVCTAEACAFRDNYDGIAELGAQIVGVSPQSSSSHERFTARYDIPFPLLADTDKRLIRAYGVDGPFGIGVRRVTYLIGRDGVVRKRTIADFSVSGHLDLLKSVL